MTAWELIEKCDNSGCNEQSNALNWQDVEEAMIKFAKWHVSNALREAQMSWKMDHEYPLIEYAYDLKNIK